MILKCYLDDSKDWKQEKISTCAGFIGNTASWETLASRWNDCLARHGIAYYKTSEYKMLKGEFEKFRTLSSPHGRNAALAVKKELQAIVTGLRGRIAGIGVAVGIQDYERVAARPETQGILDTNPYHRALESVMFEICRRVRIDLKTRELVAFVHDDGDDFPELFDLYKQFRAMNRKTAKLIVGFNSVSDKEVPALQMADMLANDIQHNAVKHLKEGYLANERCELHEIFSPPGYGTKNTC